MTAPQAAPGQLVEIGQVAAQNIVARLKLGTGKAEADVANVVAEVKNAIRDEINTMSSHFTLAVSDVQTHYEAEVLKVKSAFTYVKANPGKVASVLSAVAAVAGIVGHFL
jgi:hypothetical protein